jgi:hypothetical protein
VAVWTAFSAVKTHCHHLSRLGTCQVKDPNRMSSYGPSWNYPKQAGLPAWLDGRHPLFLTENGRLIDEDGEVLDRETFIRMREELGARILTNARGKVAQVLGFSGGAAGGIVRAVKITRYPKVAATI